MEEVPAHSALTGGDIYSISSYLTASQDQSHCNDSAFKGGRRDSTPSIRLVMLPWLSVVNEKSILQQWVGRESR